MNSQQLTITIIANYNEKSMFAQLEPYEGIKTILAEISLSFHGFFRHPFRCRPFISGWLSERQNFLRRSYGY